MEVTKKIKGEYVIFAIKGSLDMNNVKYIKKIFDDAVDNGATSVAIDMISLNYIDRFYKIIHKSSSLPKIFQKEECINEPLLQRK